MHSFACRRTGLPAGTVSTGGLCDPSNGGGGRVASDPPSLGRPRLGSAGRYELDRPISERRNSGDRNLFRGSVPSVPSSLQGSSVIENLPVRRILTCSRSRQNRRLSIGCQRTIGNPHSPPKRRFLGIFSVFFPSRLSNASWNSDSRFRGRGLRARDSGTQPLTVRRWRAR